MNRKLVWLLGGLLLLLAAGLIGAKISRSGGTTRETGPASAARESTSVGKQANGTGNASRSSGPRPPDKPKVTILGEKVTLVEGQLNENGSEGPVKLQKRDGSIISASGLKLAEGDNVHLAAPLSIQDAEGRLLSMKEGVVMMSKDGVLKTNGDLNFQSAPGTEPPQGSRQEGEP